MTAYSIIGIWNMSLGRIGQPKIDLPAENSIAGIQLDIVWPFIRDEVLSEVGPKFAKTRIALTQSATVPAGMYDYAYVLPADFLKIPMQNNHDANVASGDSTFFYNGLYHNYIIEALEDETLCLFTDFDNTSQDLILTYIRRIENVARYSPAFINALSYRLAAEVAIVLSESVRKFETMTTLYSRALLRAKADSQSFDKVQHETGSTTWVDAGRG